MAYHSKVSKTSLLDLFAPLPGGEFGSSLEMLTFFHQCKVWPSAQMSQHTKRAVESEHPIVGFQPVSHHAVTEAQTPEHTSLEAPLQNFPRKKMCLLEMKVRNQWPFLRHSRSRNSRKKTQSSSQSQSNQSKNGKNNSHSFGYPRLVE